MVLLKNLSLRHGTCRVKCEIMFPFRPCTKIARGPAFLTCSFLPQSPLSRIEEKVGGFIYLTATTSQHISRAVKNKAREKRSAIPSWPDTRPRVQIQRSNQVVTVETWLVRTHPRAFYGRRPHHLAPRHDDDALHHPRGPCSRDSRPSILLLNLRVLLLLV